MQRRITIDGLTYICNVSHDDEIEYWSVANGKKLAEYLKAQGCEIVGVDDMLMPHMVRVKKNFRYFNDEIFCLKQCEGDLIDWMKDSFCGEFTYYYDKIIFDTEDGFVAAYRDDINNNWKF